jgi:hypothetical protein
MAKLADISDMMMSMLMPKSGEVQIGGSALGKRREIHPRPSSGA